MRKHLVPGPEILIDPNQALVGCKAPLRYARIVCDSRSVWQRHVMVHKIDRDRIEPALRNLIAQERGSAERIDDRRRYGREIAGALSRRQNNIRCGAFADGADPLVAQRKERLVFSDRAGDHSAELVPAQNIFRKRSRTKIASGVQLVIAEEFPGAAMKLVRTGTDLQIDIRARIA